MTDVFLSYLTISVSVGFMVLVLVILAPLLNKRYAAKWKYLTWIFLAVRLLIPLGGGNGQLTADGLSQTGTREASGSAGEDPGAPSGVNYRPIMVEIPEQMTAGLHSGAGNAGITVLDIVTLIWLTGILIFMTIHFISYIHYKRQVMKTGRLIEELPVYSQMFELKRELHIRRTIPVIEYREAGSPMIMGFLKPVLVLPAEQYSPEELLFILKHELVHFKRGDVCLRLLLVTANAIHWPNPLIWLMQKEAVIDMELSCDERVTRGMGYAGRKAYTEALLSTLSKRCAGKNMISTQFYGGTKIMKKRLKNILVKQGRKNGIFILACAVMLTISLGTLVGCSVTKKDVDENTAGFDIQEADVQGEEEQEEIQTRQISADDPSVGGTLDNTTTLTFIKEGEEEQKQAVLVAGDGYSIYLPDGEWQQSEADAWTATVNEQVRLWVVRYESESMDSVGQELADDGYETVEDYGRLKQDGDLIVHAELKQDGNSVWGIFYSYPNEAEEGWGRELPVIADTFAVSTESVGTDQAKANNNDGASGYLQPEDCEEIRSVVNGFAAAYFDGNADAVQDFLANTYQGEIDLYESAGTVSDLTVKGLSDADEKRIENGSCVVSLEFRDSSYEDMFLYLTFVLRQEDNWKVQFYGVEG